ncbi:MAG: AbrB/MazE/SpoVT family DNA-binding domain-containing protein [Sphingomonadaceae bacterium]
MTTTSVLSSRFTLIVPKSIRAMHGWKPGQQLALIPKGSGVLLMPVPDKTSLEGSAKSASVESFRDRSDRY